MVKPLPEDVRTETVVLLAFSLVPTEGVETTRCAKRDSPRLEVCAG